MLIGFGNTTAVALGMESPLSHTVFSVASAAAGYAILGATSLSHNAEGRRQVDVVFDVIGGDILAHPGP
jgi:hypothetical protein